MLGCGLSHNVGQLNSGVLHGHKSWLHCNHSNCGNTITCFANAWNPDLARGKLRFNQKATFPNFYYEERWLHVMALVNHQMKHTFCTSLERVGGLKGKQKNGLATIKDGSKEFETLTTLGVTTYFSILWCVGKNESLFG